jgi:glycolate oxidase
MTGTRQLAAVRKRLEESIGKERIISDPEIMETYSHDETSDLSHAPDLVVRAASVTDVSRTLETCSRYGVPVVPRGAGTGVTGGAIPVAGGVVLSLERMNRIVEIDPQNLTAVVEPGVITGDLQKAALEHGLMYPPDPASLETCSIGGNVAEGAGGPRAVKYGTTKDYILGLEFVLADGSIIRTGGKYVKNATGYNLLGILTGSEGTLAVITKIFLRLVPAPQFNIDLLIPYDSLDAAVDDVFRIVQAKILPACLEFMEEDGIRLVGRHFGGDIPFPDARAHLLVQLDGNSREILDRDLEKIVGCVSCDENRVIVAESRAQSERIWKTRRAIREAVTAESPVFLAEDTVVPRSCIPPFLKDVKAYLNSMGLRSVMFGHAGDGNVHIDTLKDNKDYDEWKELTVELKRIIYQLAISYGGTITGEHGTGYTRREYLHLALSREEIDLLRRIKAAFDPKNILNPQKIF